MKSVNIKIFIMALLLAVSYKAYSQTELYKQYEHRTEFTVMCIMKCPINDSLKIDVTLFVPNSKEELWPMVEEFNLGLNKDTVLNRYKKEKRYPLYVYNVYKDDIKHMYEKITTSEDYKNISKLVYSYHAGIIMIYHNIETEERNRKVTRYLLNAVKKPLKLPEVQENK